MPHPVFHFKQFSIYQDRCAMKVGTDGVLLGAWIKADNPERILDIGAGTGLLALMLAQRTDAQIDAIDIDEAACSQAEENVQASKWKDRIRISFTAVQDFQPKDKYDLIISNPPYFLNSYAPADEARKRARQASGTLTYEELLHNVMRLLSSNGKFNVILPHTEGTIFREKAMQQGLFNTRYTEVLSREGQPVKRLLMEFSRKEAVSETSVLILHGAGREYSAAYRDLTADYFPGITIEPNAAP
jgi:tRNA1Val (adenine37-N6)-methyltransferase